MRAFGNLDILVELFEWSNQGLGTFDEADSKLQMKAIHYAVYLYRQPVVK